ncbi:hypothetical protein QUF80_22920 [Desulfococcaceae bacterium HSG8]|nr:hypothetical protein [Desulfococcaceae bacterium HSG8]
MHKNRIKIIGGLLLVFLLGIVVGSLGTGIYIKHRVEKFVGGSPLRKGALVMKKLTSELDLTAPQETEIKKIVDNTLIQLYEFKQKHRPELEKIFDSSVVLIKEKLNDEQKEKMDRLHEKFKKRWGHPPP